MEFQLDFCSCVAIVLLVSFWLRDGELFDYPQDISYLEGQKTSTDLCSQKKEHDLDKSCCES